MGTLDPTPSDNTRRKSRIVDLTGLSRPATKTALDEWLNKGWRLSCIYPTGSDVRAVFIKDKE